MHVVYVILHFRLVPYVNPFVLWQLLIPIFTTHVLEALFNQARLPCGLNSCIIVYFILLNVAQAHATYWGN